MSFTRYLLVATVVLIVWYIIFGYTPYQWFRSWLPQRTSVYPGYESGPSYNPQEWNTDKLQRVSNCYSYALDDVNNGKNDKHQPGMYRFGTFASEPYRAPDLIYRVLSDNPSIRSVDISDIPPNGFYRVVLFIGPGDYHFMRQDVDGYWSHKPGRQKATNTDWSGNRITDPLTANTGSYIGYAGAFHVPNNATQHTNSDGRTRKTRRPRQRL